MSADNLARRAAHSAMIVGWVSSHGGTQEQAAVLSEALIHLAQPENVEDSWRQLSDAWVEVLAEEPQVDTDPPFVHERLRWLASQLPKGGASWWEREDMIDVVPMVAEIIGDHFHGNAASAREEARWIIGASPEVVLGLITEIDVLRGRLDAVRYLADNTKSCGGLTSDSEGCHVRDLVVGVRQVVGPTGEPS